MADLKKVLIVEDDSALRMALSEKFVREGFEVVEAEDGKVGMEHFMKDAPNIVLLDLTMPKKSGVEMLEEMGSDNLIPIIVLTNAAGVDSIVEVMGLGVTEYLVKSDWTINDIVKKVKDKLKI